MKKELTIKASELPPEIELVRWVIRINNGNPLKAKLVGFDKDNIEYEFNYRDQFMEYRSLDIIQIDAPEKDKEKIKKKLSAL